MPPSALPRDRLGISFPIPIPMADVIQAMMDMEDRRDRPPQGTQLAQLHGHLRLLHEIHRRIPQPQLVPDRYRLPLPIHHQKSTTKTPP